MLCSAGLFETGGEEAGFEGVHAERGVLGEGNAFHGDAFMGVLDFIRCSMLKTQRLHDNYPPRTRTVLQPSNLDGGFSRLALSHISLQGTEVVGRIRLRYGWIPSKPCRLTRKEHVITCRRNCY
jgi:hypothetical protein